MENRPDGYGRPVRTLYDTIMQKIMFDDKYGLTTAVLEGRKTMTRRRIVPPRTMEGKDVYGFAVVKYPRTNQPIEVMALDADGAQIGNILPKYKVGEVVVVAQNLRDMGYDPRDTRHKSGAIWGLDHTPAWTNKMFVSASDCIHQIRITNVSVERLQDISDEDCMREGILEDCPNVQYSFPTEIGYCGQYPFNTPREAFAALIDKISGKGTWEMNPFVFVYEFERIR